MVNFSYRKSKMPHFVRKWPSVKDGVIPGRNLFLLSFGIHLFELPLGVEILIKYCLSGRWGVELF